LPLTNTIPPAQVDIEVEVGGSDSQRLLAFNMRLTRQAGKVWLVEQALCHAQGLPLPAPYCTPRLAKCMHAKAGNNIKMRESFPHLEARPDLQSSTPYMSGSCPP